MKMEDRYHTLEGDIFIIVKEICSKFLILEIFLFFKAIF